MKKLLLALLALVPVIAFGQSPILRNNITTNAFAPTTNVVVLSSTAGPVGITTTSTNAFLMKRGVGFTFVNANTNAWAFNGTENFLPKWLTPDTLGNSRSLDDGSILSMASNGSDLTGITNSTDVIGIGDFALDGLVTDGSLDIYGYGVGALASSTLAPFSGQIFAYGEGALSGVTISNAVHIYAFGESVGNSMSGDQLESFYLFGKNVLSGALINNSVAEVYAIGEDALNGANVDSSTGIYAIGHSAMNSSFTTNSDTVMAIGPTALQNAIVDNGSSGIFAFGTVADSTMFDGAGSVFAIGDGVLNNAVLNGVSSIFGLGLGVLDSATLTNSNTIFALGQDAGNGLTDTAGASDITLIGTSAFQNGSMTNSPSEIYAFGNGALAGAIFDGGSSIYAFGKQALAASKLTNSTDIYALGFGSGASISGTLSHVFLVGSGATATANNQWVAGDSAYTYHFPGAYLTLNSQTNQISDNGTALTYNGVAVGGSGSGVSTTVTPLAYSGTNITGFNCLTNNATYTLVLTNHCLFNAATFTGLPNTTTNLFFTLALKQDSAGTWVPKFTNSIIAWAEGVQPVVTTNANAISYLYFHSHLWTNGMLVGTPNLNVK